MLLVLNWLTFREHLVNVPEHVGSNSEALVQHMFCCTSATGQIKDFHVISFCLKNNTYPQKEWSCWFVTAEET
jgi:hypothetical protein